MQKSEIVAKIEEVKKTLADLQEQLEKGEGWWEPKQSDSEEYWYINSTTGVSRARNVKTLVDETLIAQGNCYRTKEEAQKELNRRIALTAMRKYIAENFGTRVWKIGDVRYDFHLNKSGEVSYYETPSHTQSDYLYVENQQQAKQFIKDQESNLKIYFGV